MTGASRVLGRISLLSTPSLGITNQEYRYLNRAKQSFNSLSRDHSIIMQSTKIAYLPGSCFQLPLSGSREKVVEIVSERANNFQLPLSGSQEANAFGMLPKTTWVSFQLPLSGSRTLCGKRLAKTPKATFQLPLSGSRNDWVAVSLEGRGKVLSTPSLGITILNN